MATSQSGAGGKIVAYRRKQRLAATPYDRPPPQPSPDSPNWFTGMIVPSARALVSGAGKIISSIFTESESSSSEDEDSASEDDIDNDSHYEIPYDGVNMLNEKNVASPEMVQYGQESEFMWRNETKRIIEQLIMKETFSREECDRLTKLLNSRAMDWSIEAEVVDIHNKAVREAKKWFQGKKTGPDLVTEVAQGACNPNSTAIEHVESGGGSPVDVARSYMKDRAPWASPGINVEIRTPLTAKLFKERTLYSAGHDSMSSSKKRNSVASGLWNIQEELRRVRSRATEDMLRSPSTKTDPSFLAVAQIRVGSSGAGEKVFAVGERMTEPAPSRQSKLIDALVVAGVSSNPAFAALDSRKDGKACEALSSIPTTTVSGNNEISEAVLVVAECAASKFIHPSSPNHAGEEYADALLCKVNGSPATEVTEFGAEESVNGLSPPQVSLSAGVVMGQNYEQHDDENHMADTLNAKPINIINVEGDCELLSKAYMEVPIVTETKSVPVDVAQPSRKIKVDVMAGNQQGREPGRYNRKSRRRGK